MADRYSVSFEVKPKNSKGPELLGEVSEVIRNWANDQLLPVLDALDLEEPEEEDSDTHDSLAYHSYHWVAKNGRSLDLRLSTEGEEVEVQIQVRDGTDSNNRPPSHAPGIIGEFLSRFECWAGSEVVWSQPRTIIPQEGDKFVSESLLNSERKMSVVVITNWQGQKLVDPAKLQDRLLGVARVVSYDEQTASRVNKLLGGLPCYGGAVRVYAPGLTPGASAPDCPFWPRWDKTDLLKDERIWEACTLYAPIGTDGKSYENVSSVIRKLQRTEDRERSEFKQLIEDRDRQISDLEIELHRMQQAYRSLNEDYRMLKSRNWWLSNELNDLEGNVATDEKVTEFQTLIEVIEHASNRLSRVILLDNARRTASKSPYQSPEKVWEVFSAMEQCANLRVSDSLGMSVEDWFKEQGVEFAPTESKSTKEQYGDERLIEGKDMYAHFKLGSGTSVQQNYLRIHVYWDADQGVWEVGHIGPHLTTVSST